MLKSKNSRTKFTDSKESNNHDVSLIVKIAFTKFHFNRIACPRAIER